MESHSGLFSDGIVRMGIHSDSFSDGIVRMGIHSDAFSDGIVRMGIHSDAFSDGIARMHAIENACATMRSHAALTTAPEELARTHEDRKESLGITRARRRHATPRHAGGHTFRPQPNLRSNIVSRPHTQLRIARTNETKRFPGWTHTPNLRYIPSRFRRVFIAIALSDLQPHSKSFSFIAITCKQKHIPNLLITPGWSYILYIIGIYYDMIYQFM
jgi:hypothetical protein